jgi:hypothetical protein
MLIGEEDLLRGGVHHTTFRCINQNGKLVEIKKDHFLNLKSHNSSWILVL